MLINCKEALGPCDHLCDLDVLRDLALSVVSSPHCTWILCGVRSATCQHIVSGQTIVSIITGLERRSRAHIIDSIFEHYCGFRYKPSKLWSFRISDFFSGGGGGSECGGILTYLLQLASLIFLYTWAVFIPNGAGSYDIDCAVHLRNLRCIVTDGEFNLDFSFHICVNAAIQALVGVKVIVAFFKRLALNWRTGKDLGGQIFP